MDLDSASLGVFILIKGRKESKERYKLNKKSMDEAVLKIESEGR